MICFFQASLLRPTRLKTQVCRPRKPFVSIFTALEACQYSMLYFLSDTPVIKGIPE
jgi:hypothetical protein